MRDALLLLLIAIPFVAAAFVIATGFRIRRNAEMPRTGALLIALPIFIFLWGVAVFVLADVSPAWLTQSWVPVAPMMTSGILIGILLVRVLFRGTAPVLGTLSLVLSSISAYLMFGTLYLG